MFSSRFFKKFLALNLVAFSAAALFSHLPFSSTNTLVDNEASLTSTGSAFGAGLDKPFVLSQHGTSYVNNDNGYIYYTGVNNYGGAGNGTTNSNLTSFYALRKRNSTTTSAEGTEKHLETGYFEDVLDYSTSAYTIFVIDEDGAVWSAGMNSYGQLGNGGLTNSTTSSGAACYNTFQVAKMTVDGETSYITSGAKKVETSYDATLIQMEDGSLWGAGPKNRIGLGDEGNQNTFVEVVDAFTVEAHRGIIDFVVGYSASYVLFGDGSFGTYSATGEWTEVASNIKMFDVDTNGYSYVVDQTNNISYMNYTDTELTYLTTPEEEVMQVRGGGGGTTAAWGYLTTDGDLYLSSTSATANAATTIPSDTPTVSGVSYFDMGGHNNTGITYGYLEESTGSMRLWGENSHGALGTGGTNNLTFANRRTIAINKTVDLNPGLVNTPPALLSVSSEGAASSVLAGATIYSPNYLVLDYSYSKTGYNLADSDAIKIEITGTELKDGVTTPYGGNTWFWGEDNDPNGLETKNYPHNAGTYTVTCTLVDDSSKESKGVAPYVFEYTINETKLADNSAVFVNADGEKVQGTLKDVDGKTGQYVSQVPFYTGSKYSIGFNTSGISKTEGYQESGLTVAGDRNSNIFAADYNSFEINVVITNLDETGYYAAFTYEASETELSNGNLENLWMYMPKMVGTYKVVTTLNHDVLEGTDYAGGEGVVTSVSTSYLEITGGIKTSIGEADEAIQNALTWFGTKEGTSITDDVLASLEKINLFILNTELYEVKLVSGEGNNKLHVETLVTPSISNGYILVTIYSDAELTTKVSEVTEVGTYYLTVQFVGYSRVLDSLEVPCLNSCTYGVYNEETGLTEATVFEFNVSYRTTLADSNNGEGASLAFDLSNNDSSLIVDRELVNSIEFFNNGLPYTFFITADLSHMVKPEVVTEENDEEDTEEEFDFYPTEINLLTDKTKYNVNITFEYIDGVSVNQETVVVEYMHTTEGMDAYYAMYNEMPKTAGTYQVTVGVEDLRDGYISYTTTTLVIEAKSLELQTVFTADTLELSYNKKDFTNTVSNFYLEQYVNELIVDGTLGNEIYTNTTLTNGEVVWNTHTLTVDSFDVTYYLNGEVVEQVLEDGEYTVVITLKDELNYGYELSPSFTGTFTVAEYQGVIDVRAIVIVVVAVLAVVGVVVIKKVRT